MSESILICATAAITTGAGMTAVVVNHFRKVPAGVVALMASVCPWLMIGGFFTNWSWQRSQWAGVFGLFGAPLLFVIAFFLYGLGKVTPKRDFAAGMALIGMFVALGNTLSWFHLLSRMP